MVPDTGLLVSVSVAIALGAGTLRLLWASPLVFSVAPSLTQCFRTARRMKTRSHGATFKFISSRSGSISWSALLLRVPDIARQNPDAC